MCKVVVSDSKRDADFIIYNHLFSRANYRFTISQLVEELQEYNLNLSQEYVQKEIDEFVQSGLVNLNFRCYSTCGR
ncbi:MAG: hypothetical protein ACI4L2_08945 [Wujia sp.]